MVGIATMIVLSYGSRLSKHVKGDGWLRIVGYGVKGMDENTIDYFKEWMGL